MSHSPARLRIAIVGYGTAGQSAAVLLGRDGHRVEVFERAPAPGPVGAGFLLQPSGLQVLWRMGLLDEVFAHGARIDRLHGQTACGRTVMDMRYAALHNALYGIGMQRGALFSMLDRARGTDVTLHAGITIEGPDDADDRWLRDADGDRHGPFDLVLAADGAASRLRGRVGGVRRDAVYPWGALWCLLDARDWPHLRELRQRYVAARRMIGMLPVGTRPGDTTPRLSFFWSLPTAAFDGWQAAALEDWRSAVASIWPEASGLLDGTTSHAQLARASYRDVTLDRWHHGRWVLLGDAAHAMSPQLGQGVNMALLDAEALRDALRTEAALPDAMAVYARSRRRHVGIYQFWSRWLTPVFQSERDLLARARDLAFQPLGRMPGGRGHMLRVLSGTQLGAFGAVPLAPEFVEALAGWEAGPRCQPPSFRTNASVSRA